MRSFDLPPGGPNEPTASTTPTAQDRARQYYTDRAGRYGRTLEQTSEYLDGKRYLLSTTTGHIAAQRPSGLEARIVTNGYGRVVDDVLKGTDIAEALPDAWRHLPGSDGRAQVAGVRTASSHPGIAAAKSLIKRNIDGFPRSLLKGVKTGSLENIGIQAVSPKDVDTETVQTFLEDKILYGDEIRPGDNPLESYLVVSGDLYRGSTLAKNRQPTGRVSSLVIATRGLWSAGTGDKVVAPRLYAIENPINKKLVDSRIAQSEGVVTVLRKDGIENPYINGMGTNER